MASCWKKTLGGTSRALLRVAVSLLLELEGPGSQGGPGPPRGPGGAEGPKGPRGTRGRRDPRPERCSWEEIGGTADPFRISSCFLWSRPATRANWSPSLDNRWPSPFGVFGAFARVVGSWLLGVVSSRLKRGATWGGGGLTGKTVVRCLLGVGNLGLYLALVWVKGLCIGVGHVRGG